jgi:hypothetical protein
MRVPPAFRWVAAATGAAAWTIAARAQRHWGATHFERSAVFPGDDLVPNPRHRTTRAIGIDAPPERVWPWLVQVGMGRGGWYTYEGVSRHWSSVFTPNATEVLPQFQHMRVGDPIDVIDVIIFNVAEIDEGRYFVLYSDERNAPAQPWSKSWSFNLLPDGKGGSRLVIRENLTWTKPAVGITVRPVDWIMFGAVHKALRTLRDRVESQSA